MANLGISFSPFSGNDQTKTDGQPGAATTPQEAIRILSLHVPRTVGAASPIPSMLLNASGGAGFSGGGGGIAPVPGGDLEELLRRLFGQQPPAPGQMDRGGMTPPSMDNGSGGGGFTTPAMRGPVYEPPQSWMPSSAPPPSFTPGIDAPNPRPILAPNEQVQQPETPPAAPSPVFRDMPSRDRRI